MRTFKLIAARVEIASLDASVMMDIDSFNIYSYVKEFIKEHGYTDSAKYAYEIDYDKHIAHIYAITMREVEL